MNKKITITLENYNQVIHYIGLALFFSEPQDIKKYIASALENLQIEDIN